MTTHIVEAGVDPRPGNGTSRRLRTGLLRTLPVVVTALVAGAAGVFGTLLQQRLTAPGTAAVDAQAADVEEALRQDLNAGFYSPGHTYGGTFTEGTIVAQVEAHGGALLSLRPAEKRPGDHLHTAEVMLGLTAPDSGRVDADTYPVRCYRYTFGLGAYSVRRSGMACPATRSDGEPGSLAAEMGVLLDRRPGGRSAFRPTAASGHPHTTEGVEDLLRDERLVTAEDTVDVISGTAVDGGVYAVALRVNGACTYLRMDDSADAARLVPLWTAPADEQRSCGARQAVTAVALFGTDPAKAG